MRHPSGARQDMASPIFCAQQTFRVIDSWILSGNGYIDFVVPQMPLSGGTYHLAVFLESNGEILDWVDNAMQMDVINGDFYETGTGRVTPVGWEGVGVLVKHHWRLGSGSNRFPAQRISSNI